MPFLMLVLVFFIASPFILVALALKYWFWVAFGLSVGFFYFVLFILNCFSELIESLRAVRVSIEVDDQLQLLWEEYGPEKISVRFWEYSIPEPEFKVWVVSGRKIEIFFSQGFLNRVNGKELIAAFQQMNSIDFAEIRVENRRAALSARINRLKGNPDRFRYWFLSFWFYSLERLLKIANI